MLLSTLSSLLILIIITYYFQTQREKQYFTFKGLLINETGSRNLSEENNEKGSIRLRLCSRSEIREGTWEEVTLKQAPYNPHLSRYKSWEDHPNNVVCGKKEMYSENQWNTYHWIPKKSKTGEIDQCKFETWHENKFCRVGKLISRFQNSTVALAIIGDSLSWEHYTALSFALGIGCERNAQYYSRNNNENYLQTACAGSMNLAYRRSDFLAAVPDLIETFDPTIIVLNKGAHQQDDANFIETLSKTISSLEQWQSSCRERRKICWVFVRTTVPGHPNCRNFKKPVNDIKKMERHIANLSNYEEKELKYGWYNFKEKNKLMLDMFHKSNVEFDVIDAYEINIRRPDLHTDCLHSCIPGKQDVYNQILLHYLKMKVLGRRHSASNEIKEHLEENTEV